MSSRNARIGKYQVLAELGRGGMSRVYLASVAGPGGFSKLVVLKVLLDELVSEDPAFVNMFLDEAKLAARLHHPKIVQTNEVGHESGRYFMAMEYLDGQSLHRLMRRAARERGGVPTPIFLRIIADALEGLHAAHTAKSFDGTPLAIVHRDASPQNVFVTYDGQVKVMDFGIAKAAGRAGEATRLGVLKGKVVYMAPEQVVTGHDIDHRADVFSIGVLLHDFLAKKRMWEGLSEVEIVAKLMKSDVERSPKRVNDAVPAALDAICQRALAPAPDDRYPDARTMADEIHAYLRAEGSVPTDNEVGALVTELFARERAEIAAIIEHQLAATDEENDEPLPRLQSIGHETLTPASLTATPAPVPVSNARSTRTMVLVLGAALLAGVGLTMFIQRATPAPPPATSIPLPPATATTPVTTVPGTPATPPTPATVAAAPPEPAAAPAPPAPTALAAPARPTAPVAAPTYFVPRPTAPRPQPSATTTAARSATSEPPTAPPPATPRSTKPDLGY